MPDFDVDSLLAPLPGSTGPCGADLEYDPAFAALEEAAAGKPERQYGATVIPAEPADWAGVREQALALAVRTRDLRVAVWLTRSAARTEGVIGAVRGLQLLAGLVERCWEEVHPALDASDGNDPTSRLNALYPLHHAAGLDDLRAAPLLPVRASITVREIELAFGRAEARPGEAVPTQEGALPAIAAALAGSPALSASMAAGLVAAQALAAALDARLGAGRSPDLTPLVDLLRSVAEAGARAGAVAMSTQPADAAAPAAGAGRKPSGAIESREDAIRALERVCDWIERNEPTNPAPLLIQRAQRLMKKKNFLEIIRDLMPDGLGQIEKLAGPAVE